MTGGRGRKVREIDRRPASSRPSPFPIILAGLLLLSLAGALACTPAPEHADHDQAAHAEPALRLETAAGPVAGTLSDDGQVRVFRGIPFAAPPVGELRRRPPQPVAAWGDELAADAFSPGCVHALRDEGSFYGPGTDEMSEDCLYLNVWAPAEAGERRPVMFWIHGGGLRNGDGARPLYDGAALVGHGVVVVTTNYRLGPPGFLAHPLLPAEDENGSSGNYGLLDQIAALRSVQEDIAAFGGDTARVTIFGESAGAFSVHYLQASPLAAGLFHRTIGQSGSALGRSSPLTEAEQEGERFVDALFGLADGGAATLEAMRAATPEQIVETFRALGVDFPSRGNVDGWFLPRSVAEIFEAGEQNDVPVVVGWNRDEGPSAATLPPSPSRAAWPLCRAG